MEMAFQRGDIKLRESERKVTWSGVIAGVIIAIMIGSLLDLLGISLGAISFTLNDNSGSAMTTGSIIWFVITGIVSMYWGGWISGYFCQSAEMSRGFIHGILTYCLATIISMLLLTTVLAFFINGALNVLETSFNIASTAIEKVTEGGEKVFSGLAPQTKEMAEKIAPNLTPALNKADEKIKELLSQSPLLQQSGASRDESLRKVKDAFSKFVEAVNTDDKNEARNHLTQVVSEATGLNPAEIDPQIAAWQKVYEEQKEMMATKVSAAQDAANNAINTMGHIALINFIILLIGAVAAGLGGVLGALSNKSKI